MDSETGECYRDKETGELPAVAKVNLETGETEINHTMPEKESRKRFRVPNNNPTKKSMPRSQTKQYHVPPDGDTHFSTSDVVPCVLFLLPTTLCFYPIIAAFLSIVEVILHVWAHKKNKTLPNKEVWYQSPLHIFVREFCGACKEQRSVNKITMIQDKRNYKFIKYGIDYVRGIVT